jgi:1-acyl-sn-glycerol-3-phosphate acyltransferase
MPPSHVSPPPRDPPRLDTLPGSDGAGWALLNIAQAIYTAAWSALWITLALAALVPGGRRAVALAMARRCWGPGLLWAARARLLVSGTEHVDPRGTYVFVANHASMIDVPALFAALPVNVRFILKSELRWVPFIGWYAWATGMVFLPRGNRTRSLLVAIERAARALRGGASVVAFPEGTRTRDGKVQAFKKGAFMSALRAGVPVVPVLLTGTRDVLPRGTFRVRPGTIHVRIGSPIATAGVTPDECDGLVERVRQRLIEMFPAA